MSARLAGNAVRRVAIAVAVAMLTAMAVVASAGADNAGQREAWGEYGTTAGKLALPNIFGAEPSGSVYIGDQPEGYASLRIQKFSATGALEGSVTIPTPNEEVFQGIAVDPTAHRFYLLRDHEHSDPTTNRAPAETILVFSTTPDGSGELVAPTGGPTTLPVPTGTETIDDPKGLFVDPGNGELEIQGENQQGHFVLQRIKTDGAGSLGARYTESAGSEPLASPDTEVAIGPDGTTYLVAGPLIVHARGFELPRSLAGAPAPIPGFDTGGPGEVEVDNGLEGFNGFGPQIAVSPDGRTLFVKLRSDSRDPANIVVLGFSLVDGGTESMYGGKGVELECTIQTLWASLAAVGNELFVLDQGSQELGAPTFGDRVLRFGPGGSGCPAPTAKTSLKVGANQVTNVALGTTVTLDGSGSSLGEWGEKFESLTWIVKGPGPTFEQTVPSTASNPLVLSHQFNEEGSFTVRLKAKVKRKASAPENSGRTFDAPVKMLTVGSGGGGPTPTVTGLDPIEGPAAGGNTVTITGTELTGATAVDFGSVPATEVTAVSATTVTAKAPAGVAGSTVDVTVTTAGGVSAATAGDSYTYEGGGGGGGTPTVVSLAPAHGPAAGGNAVTITGTGLTGATAVLFGSVPATEVTAVSATTVTAKAPSGAPGTTVDVKVTAAGGTSAPVATDRYTYDVATEALAVTKSGSGSGTVTSAPAGIDCGGTCSAAFNHGTSVALTATPASGSTFGGWGGACSGTGACVVPMTAAKSVTATFNGASSAQAGPTPSPGPAATTPPPGGGKQKPLKCKAGFTKKKVHGATKCVKQAKKHKKAHHKKRGKKHSAKKH
jgi:hypothetical protein